MTYHPPGPFGPQPQQPAPYPPQYPPPGGGYPQPGPWGGPQAGGWGPGPYPPMPVSPQAGRRRAGRIVAIVAGVAVVAAIGLGVLATATHSLGAHYKLTTPDTIAGYTRQSNPGPSPFDPATVKDMSHHGISPDDEVWAKYRNGSRTVAYAGFWGDWTESSERAVDEAFSSMFDHQGASSDGAPLTVHPTGIDDATMKCQSVLYSQDGSNTKVWTCIWADDSTMGVVVTPNTVFTISDIAGLTAQIRTASRVKI